jgi:hypothetical protein
MFGCAESNFDLAPESRLPRWITLPPGLPRTEAKVTMDYYVMPWGRVAVFKLWDKHGNKLKQVKGKQKGLEPLTLKHHPAGFPPGYPSYEIITVNNVVDVIEHRKMEPIFYVTDDPEVRAELGVPQ